VGIKAGATRSEQRVNVSGSNAFFSNDHYDNFHAGFIGDLPLAKNLYLQPQILYSRKGATLLSSTGAPDAKIRINYIDVPVNVLYKFPVSFGKLFGGAGAVFSYGFAGKQEQNGHKTNLYSGAKSWKHEDLALSFTAGLELNNGLFVSLNSQKGLLDIYRGEGVSVKNRSVSVSVGYLVEL
jgi:hypothetical protein